MEEKENMKPEIKTGDAQRHAKVSGPDLRERQERAGQKDRIAPRQPRPRAPRKEKKVKQREKYTFSFKLFDRWEAVDIGDSSLRGYINLEPKLLPRTEGQTRGKFHKSKMHIVERLALKLMVSGHKGKKHNLTSGKFAGNYSNVIKHVEKALEIVEQREKKNPLEVLVKAIENAAVREEVISYQLGSIVAREAVVTSPQRRVDKTLRYMAQAACRKAFHNKKKLGECLAEEIIAAAKGSSDSFAVKEKERMEREASGAR